MSDQPETTQPEDAPVADAPEHQAAETVPAPEPTPAPTAVAQPRRHPVPAERKQPRTVTGVVISAKMNKTIVVQAERMVQHPLYRKYIRRPMRFRAHDENNECREGARVTIMATRPLSKTKRWRLVEILEQGPEF
jgi:small subunit ribosomal protein S17